MCKTKEATEPGSPHLEKVLMPQNKRHAALYQSTSLDTSKTSVIPGVAQISHQNLDLVPFLRTKFRGWHFCALIWFTVT